MLLNPLAVLLLSQLFILLLVIIFYQRLQKKRLLKDLASKKPSTKPASSAVSFNKQLVTNKLNNLGQSLPSATKQQDKIFKVLAAELGLKLIELNLEAEDEFGLGIDTDELVTQQDIDTAIHSTAEPLDELDEVLNLDASEAEPEAGVDQLNAILEDGEELDEFDLDAIEGLETSDEAEAADDFELDLGDEDLPEDTLQAAIDEASASGFNDLEKALEN